MQFLAGYGTKGLVAERIAKGAFAALAIIALVAGVYYFFFRNWREERLAVRFFDLLQRQSYEEAYSMWGCSVEQPCRYYPFEEFLEDWGPLAPFGALETYDLGRSYTQPEGVILRYSINREEGDPLWIELDPPAINFAPR